MARVSQNPLASAPSRGTADPLTDLTRLLNRLQQTVLRADAEREHRLRTSEYERRRVESNISYARNLLTRIEHESLASKAHSRRQDVMADLNWKKEVLDQLLERMADLEEMAKRAAGNDEDDSSDGEDILAEIIATPSESMDSRSTGAWTHDEESHGEEGDAAVQPPPTSELPTAPASTLEAEPARQPGSTREKPEWAASTPNEPAPPTTTTTMTTSQGLRARTTRPKQATENGGSATSSTPTATATTAAPTATTTSSSLFGNRTPAEPSQVSATTEAVLDLQRAEQDHLSQSILRMAGDLKASSKAISHSLEEDKTVLGQAGKGMDKSERSLEAATRRMGTLRRMTEGKGWLGRVLLYAWIYGLMILLVVIVFALPKLRF